MCVPLRRAATAVKELADQKVSLRIIVKMDVSRKRVLLVMHPQIVEARVPVPLGVMNGQIKPVFPGQKGNIIKGALNEAPSFFD